MTGRSRCWWVTWPGTLMYILAHISLQVSVVWILDSLHIALGSWIILLRLYSHFNTPPASFSDLLRVLLPRKWYRSSGSFGSFCWNEKQVLNFSNPDGLQIINWCLSFSAITQLDDWLIERFAPQVPECRRSLCRSIEKLYNLDFR